MRSPAKATCFSAPAGSDCRTELSNSRPPEEDGLRWWFRVPLPTPITQGATEYGLIDISVLWLPAAKTTVTPASCSTLVAWLIGSSGSNSRYEEPHELLTTRIAHSARLESRWLNAATAPNTKIASPLP